MSKYILRHLPDDLCMIVNDYLMVSKKEIRRRYQNVLREIIFYVDDSRRLDVIFYFIKFGVYPPVLERQYGYYSECHYLS
jgi:hypothetical protein